MTKPSPAWWQLGSTLWRQYAELRAAQREGRAPTCLPLLSLEITTRCNARCRMCGFPSDYPSPKPALTTAEWIALIDEAAGLGTLVISLGGGEPLMRKDAEALIARIDGHGMTPLLHTNGALLDPARCQRLARHRRLAVALSLDSPDRQQHDALRQIECYDRVIDAARFFAQHAPRVRTSFTCTITAENFRDLPELMRLADALGVRTVRFTPIHENLQHRFRDAAGLAPLRLCADDLPELRRIIETVIAYARRHGMITNSKQFLRRIPDFFRAPVPHTCAAGFFYASIDPAGQLFPCYDHQSGLDVRDAGGLAAAFRSAPMDALRRQVMACRHRCWNVGTAEPSLRLENPLSMLPQLARETLFYLK